MTLGEWLFGTPSGALCVAAILSAVVIGGAGIWKTFEKAGVSGVRATVPGLDTLGLIRLAGLHDWKIPRVGLLLGPFLMLRVPFGIARRFGKGRLFGLGLLLVPFVCFPILGFGKARYSPDAHDPKESTIGE